jgi:hypothetical protein
MKPNYGKLAAQYGSFLIAIGGVSITVLTVVLSAWRIKLQTGNSEAKDEIDAAITVTCVCLGFSAYLLCGKPKRSLSLMAAEGLAHS